MVTLSLQRLSAGGVTATEIADAVITTWHAIEDALVPVIGKRGVAALYARSLHLVRAGYPWLEGGNGGVHDLMDLEQLRAALSQQESRTAVAGGGAHLRTLSELLGSLIGVSLAGQLLATVWDNAFTGITGKENLL